MPSILFAIITYVFMQVPSSSVPRRFLNVHEYISMGLMKEYGIPVPGGAVASTPEEAEKIYGLNSKGEYTWVPWHVEAITLIESRCSCCGCRHLSWCFVLL